MICSLFVVFLSTCATTGRFSLPNSLAFCGHTALSTATDDLPCLLLLNDRCRVNGLTNTVRDELWRWWAVLLLNNSILLSGEFTGIAPVQ